MTAEEEHHAHRKNILIAVLLTCAGYALFNLGDAALKLLAARFHFSQIFITNSMLILTMMAIYGGKTEGKKAFRTGKPKMMLLRAVLAQITSLCNLFALPHIHLTTFYTLVFTSPFWVVLLSSWLTGERLQKNRLAVILFGFSVVLFIFKPGSGLFNSWAALILFGAFVYSSQLLVVRQIGSGESRPFMMMCGSVMSIILGLPFLPGHFIMPTPYEWGLFMMIGVTSSIGLLCISYAYQSTPSPSIIAPYHYTQIVWGALLGYFIFGETPGVAVTAGAVLIILAGLYLVHSETRRPVLRVSGV